MPQKRLDIGNHGKSSTTIACLEFCSNLLGNKGLLTAFQADVVGELKAISNRGLYIGL